MPHKIVLGNSKTLIFIVEMLKSLQHLQRQTFFGELRMQFVPPLSEGRASCAPSCSQCSVVGGSEVECSVMECT